MNIETHVCSMCKIDLPRTSEFFASRKLKTKMSFQSTCRSCQKEYRKKHYQDNKEKYIGFAAINKKQTVDWFENFKSTLKCFKCEESRHWVLDFHHTDPSTKDGDISGMLRRSSREALMKEVNKCIVLCSNCHRDLHYREKRD